MLHDSTHTYIVSALTQINSVDHDSDIQTNMSFTNCMPHTCQIDSIRPDFSLIQLRNTSDFLSTLRLKTSFFMLRGFTDSLGKRHKSLPNCGLFHNPWRVNNPSAWPILHAVYALWVSLAVVLGSSIISLLFHSLSFNAISCLFNLTAAASISDFPTGHTGKMTDIYYQIYQGGLSEITLSPLEEHN